MSNRLARSWAAQNWVTGAEIDIVETVEICSLNDDILRGFRLRRTGMSKNTEVDCYTSPPGKLWRFFARSRNRWKAKSAEANKLCKLQQNQIRAVEKSRAKWRAAAEEREQTIADLKRELADLKKRGTA
jgi:hypothetical protein